MSEPYTAARRTDPATGSVAATGPVAQPEETRSVGELLGDVTRDVSLLMRQEVELAKAELKQSSSRAGKGAGMLAGAAVAGFLFLLFLSVALWWALGNALDSRGWAAVIVAVIWAVIAGILALVGKKEMDKIKGMPQTADTVAKIPNALKGNEEDNR